MKLEKKKMIFVSFMLFSMFFGAGNLIFPPLLGQSAGNTAIPATIGFLITAVVLPILGVMVVAKFDGLNTLASKVGTKFAFVFTLLIYLSIGPGLAIPRAASVPYEMSIAPYLPENASHLVCMLVYSFLFFTFSLWLSLTPNKLVERMGKILTPILLILLVALFAGFVFKGDMKVAEAQAAYQAGPFAKGFIEGYQTMDAIAALNFGLVIATTFRQMQIKDNDKIVGYTAWCGLGAGTLLAIIYIMLSYMGMKSSGVYPMEGNGAAVLRRIVDQLFGNTGAVLLAAIFALACLTTCVGLITSISQYFASLTKKISYKQWAIITTVFSFIVCNQGLNTILSFSVPILNAIYPTAILLIVLGLCDKWLKDNPYVYPVTVGAVAVVSVVYATKEILPLGRLGQIISKLPLYESGMGWVTVAMAGIVLSVILKKYEDIKMQKN